MNRDAFNTFCKSIPHSTHVVQWGDSDVWKIGGKLFTVGGWNDGEGNFCVTFKCSPTSFDVLKEQPGLRPAPYLASRGMKWIQRTNSETMDDAALKDYLRESYRLVAANLTKKRQRELGLLKD